MRKQALGFEEFSEGGPIVAAAKVAHQLLHCEHHQ
jgi:hypothetical protein